MKHILQEVNTGHVTTSYYHPQGNSKVEQFSQTLHDVMSKKVSDSPDTWDIYLNQVLSTIRFNVNKSTKFPPFYLLYNRDPLLPIDNILTNTTKNPLTAVPIVSVTVLPNSPCLYREFLCV